MDEMEVACHWFALQFSLSIALPLRCLSSLFPHAPPGPSILVGDRASSVDGTGSDQCVSNKRCPRPEGAYLYIGDGHKLKVGWVGSFDVVLHCKKISPWRLKMSLWPLP